MEHIRFTIQTNSCTASECASGFSAPLACWSCGPAALSDLTLRPVRPCACGGEFHTKLSFVISDIFEFVLDTVIDVQKWFHAGELPWLETPIATDDESVVVLYLSELVGLGELAPDRAAWPAHYNMLALQHVELEREVEFRLFEIAEQIPVDDPWQFKVLTLAAAINTEQFLPLPEIEPVKAAEARSVVAMLILAGSAEKTGHRIYVPEDLLRPDVCMLTRAQLLDRCLETAAPRV